MDNEIANLQLNMREMKCFLNVLQSAAENENEDITVYDISKCIELLLDKMNSTMKNLDELVEIITRVSLNCENQKENLEKHPE